MKKPDRRAEDIIATRPDGQDRTTHSTDNDARAKRRNKHVTKPDRHETDKNAAE